MSGMIIMMIGGALSIVTPASRAIDNRRARRAAEHGDGLRNLYPVAGDAPADLKALLGRLD
ncbi:hypothetical protein KZ810_12955 [Sphingomonas sp. RHCKR47]|uniref:hypothetical protein n=1 Tax=Sphingomonas citricola TaxID=2862498 RepID=UPI001CA541E7|nr:hypothetical protein [Sphingomonas citricola]MBW6524410.1 hypothetical protein [Sphingomonas citricola]